MTMRQTSLKTYTDLWKEGHLGFMQTIVLKAIIQYPNSTDRELEKTIGAREANQVRPRRNELAAKGLIYETGSRPCTITGRKAITWRAI